MPRKPNQHWPRWTVLAGLALAQALLALVIWACLLASFALNFRGPLAPQLRRALTELSEASDEWEVWRTFAISLVVIFVFQAIMLWPIRRPAPVMRSITAREGRSLWFTIATCGLLAALIWSGAVLALLEIPALLGRTDWIQSMDGPQILLIPISGWLISTPFIIRFMRRGRREDQLGRISSRLLLGTIIEVIAIIPVDVMVRRKTDCYCGRGTFLAMLACATVGVASFGPAILLPLVARRRKRWYAGRCESCDYDMSGLPAADCCPECGVGWKSPPSQLTA